MSKKNNNLSEEKVKDSNSKTEAVKSLNIIEKNLYILLLIITICLLPIIIYSQKASVIICSVILAIELIGFVLIKKYFKNFDLENKLLKQEKKLNNLKNVSNIVLILAILGLVILIAFMLKDLIVNSAFKYVLQILSLNIISFAIFALLIVVIYNFTNEQNKEDKSNESETQSTNLIFKNKNENKALVKSIFSLYILIAVLIPYIYTLTLSTAYLMKTVWTIGIITTLIFGILLSVVLRNKEYNKTSYQIIALSYMIVGLVGIFSNISILSSFIAKYIIFIFTFILSFIMLYRYDKKTKLYFGLLLLIYVASILALILA